MFLEVVDRGGGRGYGDNGCGIGVEGAESGVEGAGSGGRGGGESGKIGKFRENGSFWAISHIKVHEGKHAYLCELFCHTSHVMYGASRISA